MTEHALIRGQRLALRELIRLAAEKVRVETATEAEVTERKGAAGKEVQEARQRLTARRAAEIAAAESEYQETVASVPARFDEKQATLEKGLAKLGTTLKKRVEHIKAKAEKKVEQSRLNIYAVAEAKEHEAQAAFQKELKRIAAIQERLQAIRIEAATLLKQWKQPGINAAVPVKIKAEVDPEQRLEASASEAEELVQELKQLSLPRFFKGVWPVVPLVIIWAVLAGVLQVLPAGAVEYHWLAVSIGGAVLLEVAIVSMLYVISWSKVQQYRRPLIKALGKCEVASQRILDQARRKHDANMTELSADRSKHDADLHKLEAKHADMLEHLQEQHRTKLRRTAEKGARFLKSAEERREKKLLLAELKHRQALQEAQQRNDIDLRQAEVKYRLEMEGAVLAYEKSRQELASALQQGMTRVQNTVAEISRRTGQLFPPWHDASWKDWSPAPAVSPVLRFGEYEVATASPPLQGGAKPFMLPALLTFPGPCSMLLEAQDTARKDAVACLQALMLRLMIALPPGKVRFTIIDPVGLGENFSAFMHLTDYDEALVNSRIWTESVHIAQRLADLAGHMENVIQKYLRNQFQSIEEYNAQAGEVAEPYRILVVANFPTNFTPESARRLVSIASSGAACGVHTLVSVDTRQPMPDGFQLADLEQCSTTLTITDQGFQWRDPDFGTFPVKLDGPPEAELLTRLLHQLGELTRNASKVEVPFDFIAPPPESWWQSDSRKGIDVPLGRAGALKRQHLRLGSGTAHHVLMSGKTGSGKSTLLHVLITNLALHYSPDEVELYLVDFKKGVEFKTYAALELPHARVVAVESEREFGLSVLQRLDAELKERGDRFRKLGVQNLAEYRAALDKNGTGGDNEQGRCPRILLIVDEFQEFFVEDDKVAQEATLLLDRLVRQGRAFGMHVLLGSQTLAGAYSLARSTIDQMAVRIALQCSEADAHLILSKDNSAARLLSRPGEAIYNDANGLIEGNDPFQVVWFPDQQREELLAKVREMDRAHHPDPRPQIVFEGNVPAVAARNHLLRELLEARREGRSLWSGALKCPVWLGEAIAIKDPTSAVFQHQTGSNLLLVGQQEEAALGILAAALVSLAAQAPSLQDGAKQTSFFILDGSPTDAPHADFWLRMCDGVGSQARTVNRHELQPTLAEIAAEVARRQAAPTNGSETKSLFLFIWGLHRFRDLRRSEDDFGYTRPKEGQAVPPAKLLETILAEGPQVGVHTLVWCDGLINLQRAFDRRTLREFSLRVLFQMSANDSSSLIDSPAASKLGVHCALFFNEDLGQPEKFRPYGLPSAEWLEEVKELLAGKGEPAVV